LLLLPSNDGALFLSTSPVQLPVLLRTIALVYFLSLSRYVV